MINARQQRQRFMGETPLECDVIPPLSFMLFYDRWPFPEEKKDDRLVGHAAE
jgi:hypothetical protein